MWIASSAFLLYFLVPVPPGHVRLDLSARGIRRADPPPTPKGRFAAALSHRLARCTSSRSSRRPSRLASSGTAGLAGRARRALPRADRAARSCSSAPYVTVRGEEALAEARTKADEPAEAPFHGVPISLKDLDTTAGIRTTFSSQAFASNVPDFDLAHVTRLKAAGLRDPRARRTRPSSGRPRSPTPR